MKRTDWRSLALCAAGAVASVAHGQSDASGELEIIEAPLPVETLRTARDSLVGVGDLNAALDPARRIVGRLETEEDAVFGNDVLMLAGIEAGLGDFDAAELDYLKAIDLLRDEDGDPSPRLIAAHQALGETYINTRRFPEALIALEAAQDMSRRSEGLFNVDQSGILDDLTLARLGTGDTATARELQQDRLENAVRRYGAEDPRVIPFHSHLGEYYERSRLSVSAREQYRTALEISESNYGSDSADNLELLRRLTTMDLLLGDESSARDKLAAILERRDDIDPMQRGLSLAVLGDWDLVRESPETAWARYQDAFAVLDGLDSIDADDFFSEPRMIDFVQPLGAVDRGARSRPWSWGNVVMQFDVSENGRADHVKTVSIAPKVRDVETSFNRRIRETHFRPQLKDGQPVPTSSVRYTNNFRFYVKDD